MLAQSGRSVVRMSRWFAFVWVCVLACCRLASAQNTLAMITNPAQAVGGEVFGVQPQVAVLDSSNNIVVGFDGTVYVQLSSTPTGFETLHIGGCDYDGCGTQVTGTEALVTFVNGIGTFANLAIKQSGEDFTLVFVGLDSNDDEFASVISSTFDVAVGDIYQLEFATFIGSGTGGTAFNPNPAVAIADRGGNTITSVNGFSLTVTMEGPTGSEVLRPEGATTTSFTNGVATYGTLFVNEVGGPYVFTFNASVGVYVPPLVSDTVTVSPGDPVNLAIDNATAVDVNTKFAGEFWTITPRVYLLDAGGNVVEDDSTSAVTVSLAETSNDGALLPLSSVTVLVEKGVASFTSLFIDKAGLQFRLLFTLSTFDAGLNRFTETAVTVRSEVFIVEIGPPRKTVITTKASGAFAGGRPFNVQPKVELRDYGDNVLIEDNNSTIDVQMIASLSTEKSIVIDTTVSPVTNVTRAEVNLQNGTYGAGQILEVSVFYEYNVFVDIHNGIPYLVTNIRTAAGGFATASLDLSQSRVNVNPIKFTYTTREGDSVPLLKLNDTNALVLNNSRIYDGSNASTDNTFASVNFFPAKSVIVDTTTPFVVGLNTSLADGEYGAGQLILFHVTYNKEVVVKGSPYLELENVITSDCNISDIANCNRPRANFTNILDDRVLVFTYSVQEGDTASNVAVFGEIFLYDGVNSADSAHYVLTFSDAPITPANLTIPQDVLDDYASVHGIDIDTTAPKLDAGYGVRTDHADGVFYPGELILLTMRFDKEVVISGGDTFLVVLCGTAEVTLRCISPLTRLLDDDKTMEFLFQGIDGINSTFIEIDGGSALLLPASPNFIRRKSSVPTTDVNSSTAEVLSGGNSLGDTTRIRIDGTTPTVTAVTLTNITAFNDGASLRPDDLVEFTLTWSHRVVVTCSPIVVLSGTFAPEAVFVSGNGTTEWTFRYTVAIGDAAAGLFYRFTPAALCFESGCPTTTACNAFANATVLTTAASDILPLDGGARATGVPLLYADGNSSGFNIRPKSLVRNTTITGIRSTLEPGEYGVGQSISFEVTFTDLVSFASVSLFGTPQLFLNIGKFANLTAGSSTNTFTFTYISAEDDAIQELLPTNITGTSSPLRCSDCVIRNRNLEEIVYFVPESIVQNTSVTLDPSSPRAVRVYSNLGTNPFSKTGAYSAGQRVEVYVEFDKPIAVLGNPFVNLNINNDIFGQRFALYDSSITSEFTVGFATDVLVGDNTSNMLVLNDVISDNDGQGEILRLADVPQTLVNYSLPTADTLGFDNTSVVIDTFNTPTVLNVYSANPDGAYRVGDEIVIVANFSDFVVASGRPFINLNLGDHIVQATYIGFNESAITNTSGSFAKVPSDPTCELYFAYSVSEGDFNSDLEYADSFALQRGLDDLGAEGTINQFSDVPTIQANLDMPIPGAEGSLSESSNLYVNGDKVFLNNLYFESPESTYGVGEVVQINLNFSGAVIVSGIPSITLETGENDRDAVYVSGSGTNMLVFEYLPQPGDATNDLEYIASKAALGSAAATFRYNGGSIRTASANPVQSADVFLNPVKGLLTGTSTVTAVAGVFTFLDVAIDLRGPDYTLQFITSPNAAFRTLYNTQSLFVSFSNEFELLPDASLKGDLVGFSVDVSGDIVVVGSPKANNSVTSIQTVTTSSLVMDVDPSPEIQAIHTSTTAQPGKVTFRTTGDVGSVVSGSFTLSFGFFGPTRPIPSNADADIMQSILAYDLAGAGNITVKREAYIFCACEGAHTWELTFNDQISGPFKTMTADDSGLEGAGAKIEGPTTIQSPALLSGGFKLMANNVTSSTVAFDADVNEMTAAVNEIGYVVEGVSITPADSSGGRVWAVTFGAFNDFFDVPLLEVDDSSLSGGGDPTVFVDEVIKGLNGPEGISGGYQLTFRQNTTDFIPFNATDADVKASLEALDTIEEVEVTRGGVSSVGGYTWTITFITTLVNTNRGYEYDYSMNIERLQATDLLVGSDTFIAIGFGNPTDDDPGLQRATYGADAGAVYVFQREGEAYVQVATVLGDDTEEADQFGYDISLEGQLLVVGAIGADFQGDREIQSLRCHATNGTFSIKFRGWTSNPIGVDTTPSELKAIMQGIPDTFDNLHDVGRVEVEYVDPSLPLCDNNTALITFFSPVGGAENIYGVDEGPDLRLLEIVSSSLRLDPGNDTGTAIVSEVQKGTIRPHGANADQGQKGAAYVFRSQAVCLANASFCPVSTWNQEAKLFPDSDAVGSFGSSVSVDEATQTIVIGEPSGGQYGKIYVYKYDTLTSTWAFSQDLEVELTPLAEFGSSVAVDGNTIVAGAPKHDNNTGYVAVFRRRSENALFFQTQDLADENGPHVLQEGDMYGASVAISGDRIVVGASGREEAAIHTGTTPRTINIEDTGAVFVYERPQNGNDYEFMQLLTPSNVKNQDMFGHDVAIDENKIVVSSLEEYIGPLPASKAILVVYTRADYNEEKVGGTFKLTWKFSNDTTADGSFITLTTRSLSAKISAAEMERAIENDLLTGDVLVSRSNVDLYDGGYAWTVTFVEQIEDVPVFGANFTQLTGTNAFVEIDFVNPSPIDLRGKTHAFQLDADTGYFQEEYFLTPFVYQAVDRCGFAVAVDGPYAVVGCPNRDKTIPNQNAGSASVYFLSLLQIKFANYTYDVTEGQVAELSIERVASSTLSVDTFMYVTTMDRNADAVTQLFYRQLFGLSAAEIGYAETVADVVGMAGKAFGRTQFYGSERNASSWVDGRYDYRAISDYVQLDLASTFLVDQTNLSVFVDTNDDQILELPDETVLLGLSAPGVNPSLLGKAITTLTLKDTKSGAASAADLNYYKMYEDPPVEGSLQGQVVAIDNTNAVIFSGAPRRAVGGVVEAGMVVLFAKDEVSSEWKQSSTLASPNASAYGAFGDAIAVTSIGANNLSCVAIGEPRAMTVHVYSSNRQSGGAGAGVEWVLESSVTPPDDLLVQDRFGARGTITLSEKLLVVGAPGHEAVYTYYRVYDDFEAAFVWQYGEMIRSSDFDFDVINGIFHLHGQEFGASVSAGSRSFVVGAPYADYDKLGTDLVETQWDTEGSDIKGFGRGRAYAFYSRPAEELLTLTSDQDLTAGTFIIEYAADGKVENTSEIAFDAGEIDMKNALEEIGAMGEVTVSISQASGAFGFQYRWTVTFLSEWTDPPGLVPKWNGFGCDFCTAFDADLTGNSSMQMQSNRTKAIGSISQQQVLEATDKRVGDKFGEVVALDGDQILVAATDSGGASTTTWDFEAGVLSGWSMTGTAFDHQPTYEDNSYLRRVYQGKKGLDVTSYGESSRHRGRYWVGTYERRPGNPTNYLVPDPAYPQGDCQGDGPTGTLTSDVFFIFGTKISFLIGGGCDYYKLYVELLIDGISVARQTGQCTEAMREVEIDVSAFTNRAAQIRIVDKAVSNWGHINVDDFKFDWDISGSRITHGSGKVTSGGISYTPLSGIVYAFSRREKDSLNFCLGDKSGCEWVETAKLSASDKRLESYFGASMAVDDETGVAVIGSPGAQCTGIYKERPSVYPHTNSTGGSVASGLDFPVNSNNMNLFESIPLFAPAASGAYGVNTLLEERGLIPDYRASVACGAVYVFVRNPAVFDSNGDVVEAPHWESVERAKIVSPDAFAHDEFGTSVSLSYVGGRSSLLSPGGAIAVGAIGQDGGGTDAGAVYTYNLAFASLTFEQPEFYALEGFDNTVTITILRDLNVFSGEFVVYYATSDLTAEGIDSDKYQECLLLSPTERSTSGCGDYEQTRGTVLFAEGVGSSGFTVNIVDDQCYEKYLEFIQITLSVPGSKGLQGENIVAKLRIDDDDFTEFPCGS